VLPVLSFAAGFLVAALLLRRDAPGVPAGVDGRVHDRRTLHELRRLLGSGRSPDATVIREAAVLVERALA
jgi:hypothetical protein